ncbi:MAG: hypothetical protein ABIK89_15975 [Planctomycetota bacterium]
MQFRRSGQRDDRRRRVFSEAPFGTNVSHGAGRPLKRDPLTGEAATARRSEHYGDAAFMDEQPRLTDLVPLRLGRFFLVLVVGLAVVAGLEGLYAWMPRLASATTDGRVAAFDLDGEGSLAVWFSSMTLARAGLVAILVFTIRRHRTDDYPGRYRVWLWAASCWFLLSIDETSSLHEGFKEMMVLVTGTRVFGDGSIWWAAVYFFLLGAVGTRLLVDMRECRLSTATFLGTAVCYAAAVATQLGWILPESGARGVMVEEGAEMVGNLMLLLTMGLYARHVILDAQGLLPTRTERYTETFDDEAESAIDGLFLGNRSVTVHPPHGVPRPTGRTVAPSRLRRRVGTAASPSAPATSASGSASPADAAEADAPARQKLSKVERKALRKRLRAMAAERERRQRGA